MSYQYTMRASWKKSLQSSTPHYFHIFQSISLQYSYIFYFLEDIDFIIIKSLNSPIRNVLLQVFKTFLINSEFFRNKKSKYFVVLFNHYSKHHCSDPQYSILIINIYRRDEQKERERRLHSDLPIFLFSSKFNFLFSFSGLFLLLLCPSQLQVLINCIIEFLYLLVFLI